MGTATSVKTGTTGGLDPSVLARVIEEGYGAGAWHGPDLKAALSDVTPELAFWRPAAGRHNIAEIALHHAYHLHHVRSRLTGEPPSPFLLAGDDWFALPSAGDLTWPQIQTLVDTGHRRINDSVRAIAEGRAVSPLSAAEQFEIVLGITSHAVYHAGQIQLVKKLRG
jgi:hypothetical protein